MIDRVWPMTPGPRHGATFSRTHLRWLVFSALLALAACGDAAAPPASHGMPEAGMSGKVVYQRGSDIYVQAIGGKPSLLQRGASHPRWSPDGRTVAVVGERRILLIDVESGDSRSVAEVRSPRTVAWHPSGRFVYFSDGDKVREVDIVSGRDRSVISGHKMLELDVGPDGRTLVGTRQRFGYSIMVFDIESGDVRSLESGCSASISPDGTLITNLLDGHQRLALLATSDGSRQRILEAPAGITYDNQFWTNHPDWIAGETEGSTTDIVLINARDGHVRQITEVGDASRADVYLDEVRND
jgi:dipeptidyl aminopeptidase/acylaminoacyl peptidase